MRTQGQRTQREPTQLEGTEGSVPPPTAEPRDPRDPLGAEFIFILLGKAKLACFHQPFLASFTESPSSSGTGWTLGALANCSQQNIPPHTISTSLAFSISLSFLAFFKEFSTSLFPSVSKQAAWHVMEHCSGLRDVTPSDSCAPQCCTKHGLGDLFLTPGMGPASQDT